MTMNQKNKTNYLMKILNNKIQKIKLNKLNKLILVCLFYKKKFQVKILVAVIKQFKA